MRSAEEFLSARLFARASGAVHPMARECLSCESILMASPDDHWPRADDTRHGGKLQPVHGEVPRGPVFNTFQRLKADTGIAHALRDLNPSCHALLRCLCRTCCWSSIALQPQRCKVSDVQS